MTVSSITEVPFAFPCHTTARRRYVIHDETGSIERISASTPRRTDDAPERSLGSSSASCLGETVVTTCALVEDPAVLSVSLVQGTDSPVFVELDLNNTTVFGVPAKIQCFEDHSSRILRMVDSKGIILSVTLDTTWTPTTFTLLSIPELVEAQKGFFSGAELDSSMVLFLSSTVLIMGLSPHLLAVNLASRNMVMWSETQTLEDMRSRRLGRILTKASDLLLGRLEDDSMVDMPPTAALCHASEEFVFSLHSDASVRMWRINDLQPFEVASLAVPQDAIPEPAMWSDSQGAVALCAQLYESVYTLAIHIQTVGGDKDKSACRLTVVYGPQVEEDPVRSTLQLSVPATAISLVGFDFARERCRLTALFQSQKNEAASTLLVTYPHSIVSIVSTQAVVTPHEHTLDGVAASERARLSGLSFTTNGASLEEDLHAMDSGFLKYIFRPSYPRGNGGVTPPLSLCIRAAIRKLVPGHYEGEDMTIELETLRAMHEWRRLENRGIQTPARRTEYNVAATPGGSVYDSYVEEDPDTPDMELDGIEEEDDEDDLLDQERVAQLESHEQRWRTFLLTILEEEERMREPLCLSTLLSAETSTFVLVRAGVTSLLKEVVIMKDASSKWEDFDEAAMILLGCVERSEERSSNMLSIEARVYDEIAKASLVLTTRALQECSNDLSLLGSWALSQAEDSEVNPEELEIALNETSREDVLVWLQSVDSLFFLNLPGASVLPDSADVIGDDPNETWNNRIAHVQTRHAACGLHLRCSDSVRRLRLGRFLLLSSIGGPSVNKSDPIVQAVFREYLHSISVLWSCGQLVPMPSSGLHGRTRSVEFASRNARHSPSAPPPTKRVSFGDHTSSILAYDNRANLTTVLDARLIQISQAHNNDTFGTSSPDGAVVALVRICFDSTFAAAPSSALLELGALLTPSDQSVASDYPRIALRLLTPFFVYPPSNEDEEVVLARRQVLAECLLIEANAASQKTSTLDSKIDALRTKACDLLVSATSEIAVDHRLLETVFMTLRKQRQAMPTPEESTLEDMARNEEALANELQLLLDGTPSPAGAEITRLLQQPTVRWLFLPLLTTEHQSFFRSLDDLPREYVKMTVEVLLRISKLMHRLSLLERHTICVGSFVSDELSGSVIFLLGHIEKAISEIHKLLPVTVYSSMTEYSSVWTMLFHHSVLARSWMTAHSACIGHPVPERRISCYKRLVVAMADAGSFAVLIGLCSVVAYEDTNDMVESPLGGGGDCVDLYEIAVETLAGSKQGDLYATDSVIGSTDYLGCLYALHVSRGHWKRAAQAMDAKYAIASKALSASGGLHVRLANTMNVTAAMDDLTLASLSSSNTVQLIKNPSLRFLISGEVGPYPTLPITTDALTEMAAGTDVQASSTGTKRGRSGQSGVGWTPRRVDEVESGGADDASRLSRFMTVVDLNSRAVRAIALRTMMRDQTSESPAFSPLAFQSLSVDSDRCCMDHLSSLGYYERAVLLAKAMQTQYEERNNSTNPAGRSLLHDSINRLLTFYILPVTVNLSSIPSEYGMKTDEVMSRPTLSQLRRAIEEFGDMPEHAFSFAMGETWHPKAELPAMATASAAMELTRKLTTICTSATSPFALEVAEMLLDLEPSRTSLPVWLERLLLGVTGDSDSPGLFSKRPSGDVSTYNGDPTGLLGLYTKRGMYVEACDAVSGILTGTALDGDGVRSRESRAPARLPEKGEIDFVPYDKIDVLWTLIDRTCSNHLIGSTEKKKLQESRDAIENALEKHFELMGISELGSRSARALQLSSN